MTNFGLLGTVIFIALIVIFILLIIWAWSAGASGRGVSHDPVVTFNGTIGPILGQSVPFTFNQSVTGIGPAKVAVNTPFQATIVPGPIVISTAGTGFGSTAATLTNMVVSFDVVNATIVSANISGGSNIGRIVNDGDVTVTRNGTRGQVLIPGPITSGTTIVLPQVAMNLVATAPGVVQIFFAGTGPTDPGVTTTVGVTAYGETVPTQAIAWPSARVPLASIVVT